MAEQGIFHEGRQPAQEMMGLVTGFWTSQAVYVAAKLGVADRLNDGPRTAAELAFALQVDERALYRVLRALASIGVFRETDARRFELTPLAETLRSDSPNSVRSSAMMMGEEHFTAWGNLIEGVRTGRTPFELAYQLPVFDYFDRNAEAAATFNRAMFEMTSQTHVAVAKAYDFSQFKTVVDVGGGQGTLIAAILRSAPNARGILFDLPKVVCEAEAFLTWRGVRGCEIVGGDFFDQVPPGRCLCVVDRHSRLGRRTERGDSEEDCPGRKPRRETAARRTGIGGIQRARFRQVCRFEHAGDDGRTRANRRGVRGAAQGRWISDDPGIAHRFVVVRDRGEESMKPAPGQPASRHRDSLNVALCGKELVGGGDGTKVREVDWQPTGFFE